MGRQKGHKVDTNAILVLWDRLQAQVSIADIARSVGCTRDYARKVINKHRDHTAQHRAIQDALRTAVVMTHMEDV